MWNHAILFGIITFIAAFIGIYGVNIYIERSGRQSVIAIMLVIVLALAFVSLPLNSIIK